MLGKVAEYGFEGMLDVAGLVVVVIEVEGEDTKHRSRNMLVLETERCEGRRERQ